MAKSAYKPGNVVWARVYDRNGILKDDPRPLLVIEPGPVNSQQKLVCLAISTRPENDLKDPAIEMPWNSTTGNTTGLFKWCRVVLLWLDLTDQSEIVDCSGSVSKAFLSHVIEQRKLAQAMLPPK